MSINTQIQYPDYGTITTVSDTISPKTTTKPSFSDYNHIPEAI